MFQRSPDRLCESISSDDGFVAKDHGQRLYRHTNRVKKAITFLLVLCVLLPLGLLFPSASSGASLTYQTQAVAQGVYDVTVNAGGLLQGSVYNLTFQNGPSNIISEIDVKQGEKVVRGQVLARLNALPLQDDLDAANASVKAARANVSSAIEYANATRDSMDAKIHTAWVSVDAAKNNQNAVNQQSDAIKDVANAIIQDDQRILDAQWKASRLLIRHSKVLRQQTLDTTCDALETPSTTTTTPTPTVIPTPTPTAALIGAESSYQPVLSANNPENDNTGNTAYAECVRLADTQYDQDVADARASVVNAQEQVDKDQQALDQVQATINVNNVDAQGQVDVARSLIDVAKTDTDYASALTQITSSQGQLFVALIQVNIAKHNLANTIMIAPHDGVVTGINGTIDGAPGIQTNSAMNNGSAPAGVFIQLADLSNMGQIIINVAETDILKIKVGQIVQFTLKAFGYRPFIGQIDAISPNGVSNAGSINYPVFLDIDAKSLHGLKPYPNMSANGTITVLHDRNVLIVPAGAIDFSHTTSTSLNPVVSSQQMQDAQHQADTMLSQLTQQDPTLAQQPLPPLATFVIEQSGTGSNQTFKAKPVVLLGITNGDSYEVLQGLVAGEHVVTGTNAAKTP
jgi:multidrug efflux pump subunit AcrA (membrane-fusion protein)